MFGKLSRPAVTRCAAAIHGGLPVRANLGGVTLERDGRSAARIADQVRSEPTFARQARGPAGRVPG